jgi:hypothetical protein
MIFSTAAPNQAQKAMNNSENLESPSSWIFAVSDKHGQNGAQARRSARHAPGKHSRQRVVASQGRPACAIFLPASAAPSRKNLCSLLAGRRSHRCIPCRLSHGLRALESGASFAGNVLLSVQGLLASSHEDFCAKCSCSLQPIFGICGFSSLRTIRSVTFSVAEPGHALFFGATLR